MRGRSVPRIPPVSRSPTAQRNALAQTIIGQLDGDAFGGQKLSESDVESEPDQANALIAQATALGG
jgi:hypothetical protein